LTDPSLPSDNKKAVIRELLGDRAAPLTASLLGFIVECGRARELQRIAEELAAVAAERRQHALAEVRTAVPLTVRQRTRMADALASATGRSVEVKVVVDPSVIGGVVAHVGDEVIDGSIRTRLNEAKRQLGGV
jgi:F-type H+-transporting ATPase subunit delta